MIFSLFKGLFTALIVIFCSNNILNAMGFNDYIYHIMPLLTGFVAGIYVSVHSYLSIPTQMVAMTNDNWKSFSVKKIKSK